MGRAKARLEPPSAAGGKVVAGAALAATAAAAALGVAMAIRPIATHDIGYHLAYGEHLLDTGHIVQTNRFIYTRLDAKILSGPDHVGPGCRYDAPSGTYHFVNANWLSQAAMAAVRRAGGFNALVALQAGLVAAILALVIAAGRRAGLAWHWVAPAVLLVAMASYERFNLKPELFGFVVLTGQWCLLIGPGFGWRRAAAVVALQVLAVNLHSYWLLGAALGAAMFLDPALRWLWRRTVTRADAAELLPRLRWLGIATAGMLLAGLLNPWFLRGAVMPAETLLYLRAHHIAGAEPHPGPFHPWETIAELQNPFLEPFRHNRAFVAYVALLLAGAAGALAALWRRRWGWLLVLAGMTAVSMNTRRNIGPGALILAPLAAVCLAEGWRTLLERSARGGRGSGRRATPGALRRLRRPAAIAASAAVAAAAGWWTFNVVTHRFYTSERRTYRFGAGVSRFAVPVDAAGWINEHQPKAKAFSDFDSSSNLMYFTRPHRAVPVLTNTWSHPPYVMKRVLGAVSSRSEFDSFAAEYDPGFVVLRFGNFTQKLIKSLNDSPDWALVHAGPGHVVFCRRAGPDADLARQQAITKDHFDAPAYIEHIREMDPAPVFGLHQGAVLLGVLGWMDHAITVYRECEGLSAPYSRSMLNLGRLLLGRGAARMGQVSEHLRAGRQDEARQAGEHARQDLTDARRALRRALDIEPGLAAAQTALATVERLRGELARGLPTRAPAP